MHAMGYEHFTDGVWAQTNWWHRVTDEKLMNWQVGKWAMRLMET